MNEKNRFDTPAVIISVVFVSVMFYINTASFTSLVSVIAQEMMQVDMKATQVGWLISLPAVFMIVGVILSGWLTSRVTMKYIMLFGWALFGLSGASIYLMHSTLGIMICRALMGFAIGVAQPSTKALPSRMYDGGKRSSVMGFMSMGGGIASVIAAMLFGQIGVTNWRASMLLYLLFAVICIVLGAKYLPNLPPEKRDTQKSEGKNPLGAGTWVIIFAAFYCFLIGAVIQIKTSSFVAELGLGSSNIAGIVSACSTLGIIVCGFFYGKLHERLGRWLYPLSLLITTISYFLFANGTSLAILCITGALICGFSTGIVMPYNVARVTFIAPKERVTTAITFVTLATYIGQACTTPLINFVSSLWGSSSKVVLLFVAAAYGLLMVLSVIWILVTKNAERSKA